MVQARNLELGPGFLRRAVMMTAAVGVLAFLVALVYLEQAAAWALLVGAILGAANLWLLWRLIRLLVAPQRGSTKAIAGYALAKVFGVYGLGAVLLIWGRLPPVWFLVGFSLILLVVVLKVAGLWLTASRSGAPPSG